MASLKQLEKQVARQRKLLANKQVKQLEKRKIKSLKRELVILKSPRKQKLSEIGSRIKRGGKILAKKTGSVIIKQARLIKEEQIRQNKLATKTSKRVRKKVKKTQSDSLGFLQPLDF